MARIELRDLIEEKCPGFFGRMNPLWAKILLGMMNKMLMMDRINDFLEKTKDRGGLDFIDELFEMLKFSYFISNLDYRKIPAEGKVIIVANHPLGSLDGLALLKTVGSVRRDVKIVVNDLLLRITNIREFCLPFDVYSVRTQKESINRIVRCLLNDEAVIFFPAAEVSRPTTRGIVDCEWKSGALKLALKFQVPILPIFVHGENSMLFYAASLISKPLSMFLLPHEVFNKRLKSITFKVGDPIPPSSFSGTSTDIDYQTRMLKNHVYRIGAGKRGLFKTEKTIMHPLSTKTIRDELEASELLAGPIDGKYLYLVEHDKGYHVVQEIGRLRELTFRKVGEGTGNRVDIDKYDTVYRHLVLWDERTLEIAGAYRIGFCRDILGKKGPDYIYTRSLFKFSPEFETMLPEAIEMGRSFIQYKYWKSNALDLLWKGIGTILARNPWIHYMYGPVSISDAYNVEAKRLIISYYKKYYGCEKPLAKSNKPFVLSRQEETEVASILTGEDKDTDYRNLKQGLANLGARVPILYKYYTDITEDGGTTFSDFGVDPDFNNAVDGFAVVDVTRITQRSRRRYFPGQSGSEEGE